MPGTGKIGSRGALVVGILGTAAAARAIPNGARASWGICPSAARAVRRWRAPSRTCGCPGTHASCRQYAPPGVGTSTRRGMPGGASPVLALPQRTPCRLWGIPANQMADGDTNASRSAGGDWMIGGGSRLFGSARRPQRVQTINAAPVTWAQARADAPTLERKRGWLPSRVTRHPLYREPHGVMSAFYTGLHGAWTTMVPEHQGMPTCPSGSTATPTT